MRKHSTKDDLKPTTQRTVCVLYGCSKCSYTNGQKNGVDEHIETHHSMEAKVLCTIIDITDQLNKPAAVKNEDNIHHKFVFNTFGDSKDKLLLVTQSNNFKDKTASAVNTTSELSSITATNNILMNTNVELQSKTTNQEMSLINKSSTLPQMIPDIVNVRTANGSCQGSGTIQSTDTLSSQDTVSSLLNNHIRLPQYSTANQTNAEKINKIPKVSAASDVRSNQISFLRNASTNRKSFPISSVVHLANNPVIAKLLPLVNECSIGKL